MKDILLHYNEEHPYTSYSNHNLNHDFCDFRTGTVGTKMIAGFGASFAIPFYRTWLIIRDLFVNTIQDLVSDQFAEQKAMIDDRKGWTDENTKIFKNRKFERFVFNITSALILDPIYLLAGVIQMVIGVVGYLFSFIPSEQPSKAILDGFRYIEYGTSFLYSSLADKLGIDEKVYYKCYDN